MTFSLKSTQNGAVSPIAARSVQPGATAPGNGSASSVQGCNGVQTPAPVAGGDESAREQFGSSDSRNPGCRIIEGDCLEVMAQMGGGTVDRERDELREALRQIAEVAWDGHLPAPGFYDVPFDWVPAKYHDEVQAWCGERAEIALRKAGGKA